MRCRLRRLSNLVGFVVALGLTAQAHKRDEHALAPMIAENYGMFHRFLTDGAEDVAH